MAQWVQYLPGNQETVFHPLHGISLLEKFMSVIPAPIKGYVRLHRKIEASLGSRKLGL